MSLYNMLFGKNPSSGLLLAMLGITESDVPRFRDCYISENFIAIHTRTGGGNRDYYDSPDSSGAEESDYSGPFNSDLRALPGFCRDEDDDFDCTYATFYFRPQDKFKAEFEILRDMGASRDPAASWQDLFAKLNDPAKANDPDVLKALEKSKPIVEAIQAAIDGKGPSVIKV